MKQIVLVAKLVGWEMGGDMQSVRKTFKDRLKESDRRVQTDTDWKIGLKVDRKRNREIIWHKEDSANRTHL